MNWGYKTIYGHPLKKIVIQIAAAAARPLPQPAHAETTRKLLLPRICAAYSRIPGFAIRTSGRYKKEPVKTQDAENGSARQYGVNVSEVLAYEFELETS